MLRNVQYRRDQGLYGDLQYNKGHELSESLAYAAEHMPDSCGLSHNISGKTRRDGGLVVVESIDRVISVDLVSDPQPLAGSLKVASVSTSARGLSSCTTGRRCTRYTRPSAAGAHKHFCMTTTFYF